MPVKIIAVKLANGAPAQGWKHHHIHVVKCAGKDDTTGFTRFRTEIVLDIHDHKERYYIVDRHGNPRDIEVFEHDGVKCIRTKPEGTSPDPLLLLPQY